MTYVFIFSVTCDVIYIYYSDLNCQTVDISYEYPAYGSKDVCSYGTRYGCGF